MLNLKQLFSSFLKSLVQYVEGKIFSKSNSCCIMNVLHFSYVIRQNQFSMFCSCKKVFKPIKLTFPSADCTRQSIMFNPQQTILTFGPRWFPGNTLQMTVNGIMLPHRDDTIRVDFLTSINDDDVNHVLLKQKNNANYIHTQM